MRYVRLWHVTFYTLENSQLERPEGFFSSYSEAEDFALEVLQVNKHELLFYSIEAEYVQVNSIKTTLKEE